MKIELPKIKEIAILFLEKLNKEGINSHKDIRRMLKYGNPQLTVENSDYYVNFLLSPNPGSESPSYITGIANRKLDKTLIDLTVNPSIKTSSITLVSKEWLNRYDLLSDDQFGNWVQCRKFAGANLSIPKKELESIANAVAFEVIFDPSDN